MVKEAVRREPLDPKRRLIELRRRRGLRCAVRGEVKDSRGLILEQDTLDLAHARPERPGWIASPVAATSKIQHTKKSVGSCRQVEVDKAKQRRGGEYGACRQGVYLRALNVVRETRGSRIRRVGADDAEAKRTVKEAACMQQQATGQPGVLNANRTLSLTARSDCRGAAHSSSPVPTTMAGKGSLSVL